MRDHTNGKDEDGKIISNKWTGISEDDGKEKTSVWKYLYEYDANGNVLSKKCINEDGSDDGNFETLYEYDSSGRKIREKTSYSETIYEYDDAGRLIHEKYECEEEYDEDVDGGEEKEAENEDEKQDADDSDNEDEEDDDDTYYWGHEYFYEYDKDGHLIHEKKDKGIFLGKEDIDEKRWDDRGRLVFVKSAICGEKTLEWDDKGNIVYEKIDGVSHEEKRWNSDGRLIYAKTDCPSLEKWVEYDFEKGFVRRYGTEYNSSFESVRDLSGQIVTYRHGDGFLEFDSDGILVHYFDGEIDEWYEYEFYDYGDLKKKICLREV